MAAVQSSQTGCSGMIKDPEDPGTLAQRPAGAETCRDSLDKTPRNIPGQQRAQQQINSCTGGSVRRERLNNTACNRNSGINLKGAFLSDFVFL